MHKDIKARFDAIEKRRKALVQRVQKLSADQQQARPNPRAFSPAEVIKHFALAEESNLNFLRKHPPETLTGRKPKVTFIFRKTVEMMNNPKKEIATVGYMIPKGTVDLDEADHHWAAVRHEVGKYFETIQDPKDPMVRFLFFFGLASASDFLDLIESHHTYHEERFPVT